MNFARSIGLIAVAAAIWVCRADPSHAMNVSGMPAIAIAPVITTEGYGGQVAVPLYMPFIDLNTGFTTFNLTHSFKADGVNFNGKLRLGTVPLYLSVFPFRNGFHIDAGIDINQNRASVTGDLPAGSSVIYNGQSYTVPNTVTALELSSAYGSTHYNAVAPYVGIGYGNPFEGGPWTFQISLGAMFQGGSHVSLTGDDSFLPPPARVQVKQEEVSDAGIINHDLNFLRVIPLLNIGIYYRF